MAEEKPTRLTRLLAWVLRPDGAAGEPTFPASASVVALILANLVPLYGVVIGRWSVFPVMFLYWFENVVIGVVTILRLLLNRSDGPWHGLSKVFVVPFFTFHYGIFALVHGIFVFILFGGPEGGFPSGPNVQFIVSTFREPSLLVAVAVLTGSHLFSFVTNYLMGDEAKRFTLQQEMARPYRRVVVLHLTIVLGGILTAAWGAPAAALALLVLLKTAIDVVAHIRSHRTGHAKSDSPQD